MLSAVTVAATAGCRCRRSERWRQRWGAGAAGAAGTSAAGGGSRGGAGAGAGGETGGGNRGAAGMKVRKTTAGPHELGVTYLATNFAPPDSVDTSMRDTVQTGPTPGYHGLPSHIGTVRVSGAST